METGVPYAPLGRKSRLYLFTVHTAYSVASPAIRKLFTLAVYAVASTVSMEAMYWGYWTSEVVGGLMMYTLGLYFFFKIRRAHEAEAAAPASTGART